jgi:SAM-dependent methyltransferase
MPAYKFQFDLDDTRRVSEHAAIIQNKIFLNHVYQDWYSVFIKQIPQLPEGKMLEIGSGGGFLKKILPNVITSDILQLPECDMCLSAENLPFSENELSAVFMINVLHHLQKPALFFKEATRSLNKGGLIVMIEPAKSVLSSIIYKNFHHEPFDIKAGWELPANAPLSVSNQALPWIMFHRDKPLFENQFPELKIVSSHRHTSLRYILSGGLSREAFVPASSYSFFTTIDKYLDRLAPLCTMFETTIIKKI